ncbi:MAG: adenosine deaminase [Alphaproteobacteria bacterium]|nr:adenosine deaminase [Alphaproteobacteria bacterium]
MTLTLDQFLQRMPKAELHCHLFGTIREATLADLVARSGAAIPRDEIAGYFVRGPKPKGVLHVFRALDREIVRRADDLARMTREYLEDASAHGVRYAEIFWNPTGTAALSGIPFAAAQEAIVAAFGDAARDHGIVARLVPSIDREASPAAAVELVEWMIAHRTPETIGLGIDYREPDGPPERFWKAYRLAKRAGFKLTAHAGEFGCPAAHVETALDLLEVDRIDHGYTVLDEPALARRCAERGILFTVVPTNSYYLRTLPPAEWAARHPIRSMAAAGLRIHPNTDDPTLHLTTPTRSWRMMIDDFGYTLDDLRGFMLNGLDGAWIDEATRARWRREWTAEFDSLRAALGSVGMAR